MHCFAWCFVSGHQVVSDSSWCSIQLQRLHNDLFCIRWCRAWVQGHDHQCNLKAHHKQKPVYVKLVQPRFAVTALKLIYNWSLHFLASGAKCSWNKQWSSNIINYTASVAGLLQWMSALCKCVHLRYPPLKTTTCKSENSRTRHVLIVTTTSSISKSWSKLFLKQGFRKVEVWAWTVILPYV